MNLQADFRNVTNRVIAARNELMKAELERIGRRFEVANAEANLDHTRIYLMAQPEAGSNDHQRRAYVQAQEVVRGLSLDVCKAEEGLRAAECRVLMATTDLRCAEDERRYLELAAKLAVAGVEDAAEGEVEAGESAFAF